MSRLKNVYKTAKELKWKFFVLIFVFGPTAILVTGVRKGAGLIFTISSKFLESARKLDRYCSKSMQEFVKD